MIAPSRTAATSSLRPRVVTAMAIEVVTQRVAGLDIAKASLVACVRVPGPRKGWQLHKRKFATTTKELLELLAWLSEHQVTRVGMESTSGCRCSTCSKPTSNAGCSTPAT